MASHTPAPSECGHRYYQLWLITGCYSQLINYGWWVGLGGFTIISDFRATLGDGETVKKTEI